MKFEDHYSGHAHAYSLHRPHYPASLFAWLASVSANPLSLAWDTGTGSGQVATALAEHAQHVIATDASLEQLERATPHPRVEYRCERSDESSLESHSADLITAGSAAHWFDLDAFYREVRRVAREDAVIALFSYGPRDFAECAGPAIVHFARILDSYWPERIRYPQERYATLPFPFEEIDAPPFAMSADWTLPELMAFLETWSAARRYHAATGRHLTEELAGEIERGWGGAPALRRHIEFPLYLRTGRI